MAGFFVSGGCLVTPASLTSLLLATLAVSGCNGDAFLATPVGPTQTRTETVNAISVPPSAARGTAVRVVLEAWHPGGECWVHARTDVEVDDAKHTVTFKAIEAYTPTVADKSWGRACLDGPEKVEASFTPGQVGRYMLVAGSASATVEITN
jgi:hypothetical protein